MPSSDDEPRTPADPETRKFDITPYSEPPSPEWDYSAHVKRLHKRGVTLDQKNVNLVIRHIEDYPEIIEAVERHLRYKAIVHTFPELPDPVVPSD